jgi:hypothetical protein
MGCIASSAFVTGGLLANTNQQKRDGEAPEAPRSRRFKFAPTTWVLILLCVLAISGITKWLLFRGRPYDLATLACDRYLLVTDVEQAYRKDQSGKNTPTITQINDLKEISRSPAELNCSGLAKMSDGAISGISFRYFTEAGAPRIAYQLSIEKAPPRSAAARPASAE